MSSYEGHLQFTSTVRILDQPANSYVGAAASTLLCKIQHQLGSIMPETENFKLIINLKKVIPSVWRQIFVRDNAMFMLRLRF